MLMNRVRQESYHRAGCTYVDAALIVLHLEATLSLSSL
jgi:hypothetical protein